VSKSNCWVGGVHLKRDSAGGAKIGAVPDPDDRAKLQRSRRENAELRLEPLPRCELPYGASVQKLQSAVPDSSGQGVLGVATRYAGLTAMPLELEFHNGDGVCCGTTADAMLASDRRASTCVSCVSAPDLSERPVPGLLESRSPRWTYSIRAVSLAPSYPYADNAATMRSTTCRLRSIPL
jgi:hypothetical protein